MNKYKIKIIPVYNQSQWITIDAEEAHKAYYLFLNPQSKSVFSNGVGLTGSDILRIEPDYHSMMGWNKTHVFDSDDWNDIKRNNLEAPISTILHLANDIARNGTTEMLNKKMSDIKPFLNLPTKEWKNSIESSVPKEFSEEVKKLSDRFKLI